MESVDQNSTAYLTVSLYDKDDALAVPVSVVYKILDRITGQSVRTETVLTPASSIEIVLRPADNKILNSTRSKEFRVVIITATYGSTDKLNGEYEYQVNRLKHL